MSGTPPGGAYVARYRLGASSEYTMRGVLFSVLLVVILVGVLVPTVLATRAYLAGGIAAVFGAIAVAVAVRRALHASHRFGADDRLAIALHDDGIELPDVGFVAWDRVVGFQIVDGGITTYLRGSALSLRRRVARAARSAVTEGPERGTVGYAGVRSTALETTYAEVVAAVESAAAAHGIPVTREER